LRGRQCDPLFWRSFSYERTSKTSKFRDLLIYNFVSLSVPAHRTNRDVVEQIATESHIPIESLSADLNEPVFTRGQTIFAFTGEAFDEIADNYDNMQWWISDIGLNMAIVVPTKKASIPTLDDFFGRSKAKKPGKRNRRYRAIDEALKKIAETQPSSQEDVFELLDGRAKVPPAEPFTAAGGWTAGFRQDPAAARAWLSKRWHQLGLDPLVRGPKKPKK